MLLDATQVPRSMSHTLLGHSPSTRHSRQAPASHIGVAVGQSFIPARHATQPPPTQNMSSAACAAPGHCVLSSQLEPHNPETQNGAEDSQSEELPQVSAMHWLPRHTSPSLHVFVTGILLAAQSAASMQQRFGLGLVHPNATTMIEMKMPLMSLLSASPRRGC